MKKTIRFSRFDATLDTDMCNSRTNAELTVTLRMGFCQINPAGGAASGTYNDYGSPAGTPRKIVKWSASEWNVWKTNFCRSAERFWRDKFWLINNRAAYPFRSANNIFVPNVWCNFDLIGRDVAVGAHHHVIDVVRLDPAETWFGSHSTLYDSADSRSVQKGRDSKGKPIMQRAHVHEVGHLLGLGHVDIGKAHCPPSGNTNAGACYGVADTDKNTVMGQGMALNVKHATPWIKAFNEFLKTAPRSPLYTPMMVQIRPTAASMRRCYPRTIQEFRNRRGDHVFASRKVIHDDEISIADWQKHARRPLIGFGWAVACGVLQIRCEDAQ